MALSRVLDIYKSARYARRDKHTPFNKNNTKSVQHKLGKHTWDTRREVLWQTEFTRLFRRMWRHKISMIFMATGIPNFDIKISLIFDIKFDIKISLFWCQNADFASSSEK